MVEDAFDVEIEEYQGIDIEASSQEELDRAAVKTMEKWRENMLEADYRATGDTVNSLTIESPDDETRVIGTDRIAAWIGEKGRDPGEGFPPVDALSDWVHEKPGLPSRGETVEWDFGDGPRTVTHDQAVFLIGRAIDERGLPAYHFAAKAMIEIGREYESDAVRALEEMIEEESVE